MNGAWRTHQKYYLLLLMLVAISGLIWVPSLEFQLMLLVVGVALVGIEHGAIDHRFGKSIIKSKLTEHWHVPFSILYLGFAGLMLTLWIVNSVIALCVFLLLAVPHFGYVDVNPSGYSPITYHLAALTTGTFPILLPVLFSPDQVTNIFNYLLISHGAFDALFIQTIAVNSLWGIIPVYTVVIGSRIFDSSRDLMVLAIDVLEAVLLTITFWTCQPLIAFGIYYCFGHSFREGIEISLELNSNDLSQGVKDFVRSALPITLVTLAGGALVWFLMNTTGIRFEAGLAILVFIGLSSLLVPHMLVELLFDYYEDVET